MTKDREPTVLTNFKADPENVFGPYPSSFVTGSLPEVITKMIPQEDVLLILGAGGGMWSIDENGKASRIDDDPKPNHIIGEAR
jgi:hypothetical protein